MLLKKGLIRLLISLQGSPMLFIPKLGGKQRICINYRALNQATTKNGFPLPRIQDYLNSLGGAKQFSKLNLVLEYQQLLVNEANVYKTTFNTRNSKYEFIVMPFRLTNAPTTFQALINNVLRNLLQKNVIVYLDDILIYSSSLKEY